MATVKNYTIPDWHQANSNIQSDATEQRYLSNETKYESRRTVDVTNNRTRWEKHLNDVRLEDRLIDIEKWRNELERVLSNADQEIRLLQDFKDNCDHALAQKAIPESVNAECLAIRSQRREIDHVLDKVNDELLHEEKLVAECKRILAARSAEAFDMLMKLKAGRDAVASDLGGKYQATDIDQTALGLNENSTGLVYVRDLSRVALGNSTPESWNAFSQNNRDNMEELIRQSTLLRDMIETDIQNTANDLEAQRLAVNYAFRNRIHEFEQAKSELIWQKERTQEELAEIEAEIRGLEAAIAAKAGPLKVAYSRLELRKERPGIEFCKDSPALGLHEEIRLLEKSLDELRSRLAESHAARDRLSKTLATISHDLDLKIFSLNLDNRCMDVRKKLTVPLARTPNVESTRDTFTRTFN